MFIFSILFDFGAIIWPWWGDFLSKTNDPLIKLREFGGDDQASRPTTIGTKRLLWFCECGPKLKFFSFLRDEDRQIMKCIFAFILISASLVNQRAYAQDSTSISKIPSNSTSEGTDLKSSGEGESTASGEHLVQQPQRAISAGLWSRTARSFDLDSNPAAYASTLNVFTEKYEISKDKFVGLGEQINVTYGKSNSSNGHANFFDPFLLYTDSSLFTLPFGWVTTGMWRQYLPLGESSRFYNKQSGTEQLWLLTGNSFGKFSFVDWIIASKHNNTIDYYADPLTGQTDANSDAELDHYIETDYHLTSTLMLWYWIGSEHVWYRETPSAGPTRVTNFYNEVGINVKVNQQVNFSVSLEDDAALGSQNSWNLMKASETTYNFYLSMNI